jgi:hypothetical protein
MHEELFIKLFSSNFDPYSFIEIEVLKSPFLAIDSIEFLEDIIFKDIGACLFKMMNFFINNELILINSFFWIFHLI